MVALVAAGGCATAVRPGAVDEPPPLVASPPPAASATPRMALGIPARPLQGAEGLVALCEQLRDDDQVSSAGGEVERAAARDAQRARRAEAASARYVAEVTSSAFAFRRYDDGLLPLDLGRGVTLGDGAQLYATGDDVTALAFAVAPDAADQIERAHREGALRLALVFRPARSQVRGDLCLRQGGGQIVKMTVEPLAAYLVDAAGRAVARSEGDEFSDVVASQTAVKEPTVKIGKPSRDDAGELPAPVSAATDRLTPELLGCYRASLARKPGLRGTLVVGAQLAADGRLDGPKMQVSSIADDDLVACVLERMARARLAGTSSPTRVSIPIKFGDRE